MPRAKKKTTEKKPTTRKRSRKGERRTASDRRRDVGDVFWTKVVKGFEKLLESPFK